MKRELHVRENYPFISAPKIIEKNVKAGWYKEEIIYGIPLDRYINSDKELLSFKVLKNLSRLHHKSREKVVLEDYIKILYKIFKKNIKSQKKLNSKNYESLLSFYDGVINMLSGFKSANIYTSYSHGDFHKGNILCCKREAKIIDWENYKRTHIAYDLITFLLESRSSNNFHKRFRILINEIHNKKTQNLWPEVFDNNKIKIQYLLLFILEDINFFIDENNNDQFYNNEFNSKKLKEFIKITNDIKNYINE